MGGIQKASKESNHRSVQPNTSWVIPLAYPKLSSLPLQFYQWSPYIPYQVSSTAHKNWYLAFIHFLPSLTWSSLPQYWPIYLLCLQYTPSSLLTSILLSSSKSQPSLSTDCYLSVSPISTQLSYASSSLPNPWIYLHTIHRSTLKTSLFNCLLASSTRVQIPRRQDLFGSFVHPDRAWHITSPQKLIKIFPKAKCGGSCL